MNGADSEPGRQLPTTAAKKNDCNATQVTSVMCRRWRASDNRIFVIKVIFVGYQFLTDFDSQNRCLCSRRSHGPLFCAFCLCFHFNGGLFLFYKMAAVFLAVLSPYTMSICDTTGFGSYQNGGRVTQVKVPKTISFVRILSQLLV